MNTQHPNIKFTCEIEINKTLSFLDISITRSADTFVTSVYRKPTFTGLFTNFESFLPVIYKKGLIFTLLFRYFNLCSSYAIFHKELIKFKTLLRQNGYPDRFIDHCVHTFLKKIFSPSTKASTVSKLKIFLVLPFTGNHSLQIRQQLNKLISSAYPQINLRIIFRPACRITNFFRFKDRVPLSLRSHVVYKFTCQCVIYVVRC